MEVFAHFASQFIVLCEQMGQGVLVVGTITYMVVHKNIRLYHMEYLGKSSGVLGIHFYEVTIQIVISGVAPKSVGFWTVLIGSGGGVSVERTAHIIDRNGNQYGVLWSFQCTCGQIAVQHHGGVDTIAFPRMYTVIY